MYIYENAGNQQTHVLMKTTQDTYYLPTLVQS